MSKRKWTDEQVAKALSYDGLAEAEQVTGGSYKTSPETLGLGISLLMRGNDRKDHMLKDAGDVYHRMPLDDYCATVARIGFERVWMIRFANDEQDRTDSLQVWWNDRIAALLVFDTYFGEKQVNGGKVYYCWKPNDGVNRWDLTSSGGFEKTDDGLVWMGDHDCREGICIALRRLEQHGRFVTPWVRPVRAWIRHYMDHRDERDTWRCIDLYNATSAERWPLLPERVRKAVRFDESRFAALAAAKGKV